MTTIILKLKNKTDGRFVSDLLRRLNIAFEFVEERATNDITLIKETDPITELFGSWESELSVEDHVKSIRAARFDNSREIIL